MKLNYAVSLILLLRISVSAQVNHIDWWIMSEGAGISNSSSGSIISVIGQPFTGVSNGNNTKVISGFLGFYFPDYTPVSLPDEIISPEENQLNQNYPNPFEIITHISWYLKERCRVSLLVFNSMGETISDLKFNEQEPGFHQTEFSAEGLKKGIYFYRLTAGDCVATRKMIIF